MIDMGAIALRLPEVTEGIACAGTALESRTYKVNGKSFLFVSPKDARLKLKASAAAAKRLGFEVGANGWVKILLGSPPPRAELTRWIEESHALIAGAPKQQKGKQAAGRKKR